jgi:signal transduction histidine kinase
MGSFAELFSSAGFMPHGHCYLWKPGMLWLQVVTNGLIGLAYLAISITLVALVRKGDYLPFKRTAVAFGTFIVACGLTHFSDIYVIWNPAYWLDGSIRAVTALASVGTAVLLPPLVPRAIALARGARAASERGLELEAAVRELGRLYEKTKEVDELKTQFFANVSHELRTPLALILGPVERLLASRELSAAVRRELDVVGRNARLLRNQVDELLDFARLDSGKAVVRYARVDLGRVVRTVAALFEGAAAERAVRLRVDGPASLEAELDPEKIERVVLNLISNAFKFTPAGGGVRVSFGAPGDRAETVSVEVADSGPSVAPEHRVMIFERFRQADGGATRKHGGIGLGLAICKELVELHGGSIAVDDAPEGGALFRMELPRAAPPGTAVGRAPAWRPVRSVPDVVPQIGASSQNGSGPPAASPERPLVLVVEDNVEMNRFVCDLLAPHYRVESALDGERGLELAVSRRPDLIVTDVMMPYLSGDRLVAEVRTHPELDAVPIVAVTAKADDELRERLLREGVQDYVTKPFSGAELRARVANLVRVKRARDLLQGEIETQTRDIDVLAAEATERERQLEIALESMRVAREQAEQASRSKTNFLSLVSHELRTPLAALRLQLERLKTDAEARLSESQRTLVARMTTSATRLQSLIESLLEYARIQSGRLSVDVQSFDPTTVVVDTLEEVRPQAHGKGLELRLEPPQGVPPLETDPHLLRLILTNLVGNAVKFTQVGLVTVGLSHESGTHRFWVRDTGPGIADDQLQRIFEPFEQGEPTRQKHATGVGLGLALVKEMVAGIGGSIMVDTEPGIGSTFTVVLPRRYGNALRAGA